MQDDFKMLYEAISKVIHTVRKDKNIKYTDFCYENDIPMSTYDAIINATIQSSFYNIGKVVKALGLSYAEFGALLDKELPKEYWDSDS